MQGYAPTEQQALHLVLSVKPNAAAQEQYQYFEADKRDGVALLSFGHHLAGGAIFTL
jgi:hypothetical protein